MTQSPHQITSTELVWPGKRTEVERVALPFQTVETVNKPRVKQFVLWRKLDAMTMADVAGVFDAFHALVYNSRSMRGRETGGAFWGHPVSLLLVGRTASVCR